VSHTRPEVSDERLHTGGLMRCCIASWEAAMGTARGWQDGDVIHCRYATDDDSHRMVREAGVWSWAFPRQSPPLLEGRPSKSPPLRWHVVRNEWSPSQGLRTVTLTRDPVRHSKRHEALSDALGSTYDHMERGGYVWYFDLRPHDCLPFMCQRMEDHVYCLFFDDRSRIATLRMVPA